MSLLEAAAWIGAGLSALGLTDYLRARVVQPGTRMLTTAIVERMARQWFGLKHSANLAVENRNLERELAAQTRTINRLLAALEVASRVDSMIGSSSPRTDSPLAARPKRSARPAKSSRRRGTSATKPTASSPDS